MKLRKIFKSLIYWKVLLIILISILAYGQTIFMYFWQDDSALIFKLQHPQGPAGSFGEGIIGSGPYKYLVTPFVPLFPLFGLQPFGYFLIGFLTYCLAILFFWFLAKELFINKKAAILVVFIFASGYIGSDTMFRIINSWQSNIGLVFSLLALLFYTKFINKSENKYYFLSLLSYIASIELVYIRSHSLVASVIALGLILKGDKSFKVRIFRFIPFVLFFYIWYLRGPTVTTDLILRITGGEITLFTSFFASVGNSLFPSIVMEKLISLFGNNSQILVLGGLILVFGAITRYISKRKLTLLLSIVGNVFIFFINYMIYLQGYYWYRDIYSYISGTIGILLSFNIVYLGLMTWKRKDRIGKILIIGFIILASQIFGYFMQYPTAIFSTTHRYLYFTFIGYCIVYAALFSLFKAKMFFSLAAILILSNLALGLNYQANVVSGRSNPTRFFYQTLLKDVPKIEKGAIFYFDVKGTPFYQKQFNDFFSVGSMPESTALAIYYGLDRDDITFLTNFDELIAILSKNPERLNSTYAFYYGEKGLVDQTNNFRSYTSLPGYFELSFQAKVTVEESVKSGSMNESERNLILAYLDTRDEPYTEAKVSSLSEWKYQETIKILDNNIETSWRGHRIYWDDNEHESITIDLGKNQIISRFVWTNWIPSLTPTSYTIQTSKDNNNWNIVARVENGQSRGSNERVEETFSPVEARFIKMDIESTLTNDSPAIIEVEVIQSKFDEFTLTRIEDFLHSPFSYINNPPPKIINLKVKLETDKGIVTKTIPVKQFNAWAFYSVYLQAGGTKIESITVSVDDPLKVEVGKLDIQNLNLKQMQELKLIKDFSKN